MKKLIYPGLLVFGVFGLMGNGVYAAEHSQPGGHQKRVCVKVAPSHDQHFNCVNLNGAIASFVLKEGGAPVYCESKKDCEQIPVDQPVPPVASSQGSAPSAPSNAPAPASAPAPAPVSEVNPAPIQLVGQSNSAPSNTAISSGSSNVTISSLSGATKTAIIGQ
ncbi:MAG: hypothetical protein ACXWPM_09950 [Bdellovibrionota bacterium]